MTNTQKNKQCGFSLIEMLVVLAILAGYAV